MDRTAPSSDAELLRRWADDRSAEAFASLAERYAGFVHAIAVRSLHGDRTAADDVTQAVFVLLSEKAARLDARPSLAAWLHRTTCFAAANARRTAGRRIKYERAVAAERPEASMNSPTDPGFSDRVDAAVHRLRPSDRQLIVERYLLDRGEADLARSLDLSHSTLQRRLSRALERLRSQLGRSAPSAAVLPALLLQQSSSPASAALVHQITQTAAGIPPADAVGPIVRLTRRNLSMETLAKVSALTAVPVAGLGLIVAAVVATQSTAEPSATAPATQSSPPVLIVNSNGLERQKDEDVAALAKRMQGRFRITATWVRGKSTPVETLKDAVATITHDRFDITGPEGKHEGADYTLSPGEPWVGITMQDATKPDRIMAGIIRVDGDRVLMSFSEPNAARPAGFPPDVVSSKAFQLDRIKP